MAAIKYVFAKNAADLEKIQASAVRSVQSARTKVQIAAVATIRHAYDHGDWTYAGKLVEALGNTINGKALVEWFVKFGGLKINDEGFTGWSGKQHIEDNFEEAKSVMWWELKPQSPFKGFDLEEALKRVIAQHAKVTKAMEGMSEEDKAKVKLEVNNETIQAVVSLCNFEVILGDDEQEEDIAA